MHEKKTSRRHAMQPAGTLECKEACAWRVCDRLNRLWGASMEGCGRAGLTVGRPADVEPGVLDKVLHVHGRDDVVRAPVHRLRV